MGFCHLSLLAFVAVTSITVYGADEKGLEIFGGHEISIKEVPYMVYIEIAIFSKLNRFGLKQCSGSLISDQFVLTAAHCFKGEIKSAKVTLGTNIIYGSDDDDKQVIQVDKHICHEDYHKNYNLNDICVLKLAKPVEFGPKVKKIRLSDKEIPSKALLKITGWGKEGTHGQGIKLRSVIIPLLDDSECSEAFYSLAHRSLPETVFCTRTSGQGICYGDSGGPVVFKGQLVGVTKAFFPPGTCEIGIDMFMKVSEYIPWIKNVIKNN